MAKKAGLPSAGSMAIHHELGNRFGITQGIQFAKDIMNHHTITDGVYHHHYSMNTDNFQPQALLLGEVAGAKDAYPGQQFKASPEMVEVLQHCNEVVEEFIKCFTGPVLAYNLTSLAQLNIMYNKACGHTDGSTKKGVIMFKDGMRDTAAMVFC
ncbi:hypothetical protein NLJ89_g11679 [Agrocybe chaxingu]|uniref:Uncharacterized protein n=1 Tax=Agrocybe chaxingu TaxID=84603 RepID=A0A9W8MRE1_9AGAR|nr:hypothetical protein NLJ89_g11679 [Agrocybe chaxingu]